MNERLGQEPTVEAPLQSQAFEKGRKDYQALASDKEVEPCLIIDGKEHQLNWKNLYFRNPSHYAQRLSDLLSRTKKAEDDSKPCRVTVKDEQGLTQFLPPQTEEIEKQLFGFAWAALQAGDLPIAYSILRAIGTLAEKQVVEQFKKLITKNGQTRQYLLRRREAERSMVIRFQMEENQSAEYRANQALVALEKILN